MASVCPSLSNRTETPVVLSTEPELNELFLSEYQNEAENTTITVSCDSTRTLIGPRVITCTKISPTEYDWRPLPRPSCIPVTTDPNTSPTSTTGLTQEQQILIGCGVVGFLILVIIIGIMVYHLCWPFKKRGKKTSRTLERHHYLGEKNLAIKRDLEYYESKPPPYALTKEPLPPGPAPLPIKYIEAPMQRVQPPMQLEEPVLMTQPHPQMIQERFIQEQAQMIEQPAQMTYEQPMGGFVQVQRQKAQIVEAPRVYEHAKVYEQANVHMQRQTTQVVGAPMVYEQAVVQAPVQVERQTTQVVEAPMVYEQAVVQAPVHLPQQTTQVVEAPMINEQALSVIQAPVQIPRQTTQVVEAPMVYERPLSVIQAPVQAPLETRQIVEAPVTYVQQTPVQERRFQSQVMVVPASVPEPPPRKHKVIRRQYHKRHVGPSVRAISASEHANLRPSKYFVQEPIEEFVTYDRHGVGRTALETLGREGEDGWRTVEAPLKSRTRSATNSNVYFGSRSSSYERYASRSHHHQGSRDHHDNGGHKHHPYS